MHITQLFSVLALAALATAAPAPAAPDTPAPSAADRDIVEVLIPQEERDLSSCSGQEINICKAKCRLTGRVYKSCEVGGFVCVCGPKPKGGGGGGGGGSGSRPRPAPN